ncbi:MAG TPA: nicotinate phosphoribosyltransferase [Hyphomicrobiales bacterium]|nr:nicotinate phosphoribosyltransferase [Hyphomicrobiales bacterium]
MDISPTPLLTDLYQLNMMQAYLDHGMTGTAVFEFFIRRLPPNRGFLVAAGLEQALEYLEAIRFSEREVEWLAKSGRFRQNFLDYLSKFRFTGEVHAIAEGTVCFPNEPIVRVTAPLPEAQLVETRLINLLHFQSMIASKAARYMLLAPGKELVDFGLRRAHGGEAGLLAARASYIAGFAGTATVLAGELYGIPLYGTMAHSFIEAFDDEVRAFEAFARSRPDHLVLLIDTYDTEAAARKVVGLAKRLQSEGIKIKGVRLDSGDLIALSKSVRRIFDEGNVKDLTIFASGGIDEPELAAFQKDAAPIDGFGIGTSLTTSYDRPALDCAYKLQEYNGVPRRKRSPGKLTWPGRKQVWRQFGADGRMAGDVLSLENDAQTGEALLKPVMREGRRIGNPPSLAEIRAHAALQLDRLPARLRQLDPKAAYRVTISKSLHQLAEETDRRLARQVSLA